MRVICPGNRDIMRWVFPHQMKGGVELCDFFMKTGACKHGEHCTKHHSVVAMSNTVVFLNVMPYIQGHEQ